MEISAKLKWSSELKFCVEVAGGRVLELNSSEDMGRAFTPMELFLVSLAGCTAMDVRWILEKQRQKIDKLEISVRGIRREEDPRYYERIDLEYSIVGKEIKRSAVERAIHLSQEKYCSVRAMLKDNVDLNISYTIAKGNGPAEKFTFAASPKTP
jgi:putative redox protein